LAQVGAVQPAPSTGPRPGEGVDCTKVTVDYIDKLSLTRDERIAAMDRALLRSLSKFDACNTEVNKAASANGGAAGSGGVVSSAASDMSGPAAAPGARSASRKPAGVEPDGSNGGSRTRPPESGPVAVLNGKIPEDLPPGDNDSVLEAQIRQAALNETDPDVRARLWNEYRRYKGLLPAN
jgi:hypothetical protein